ncbi:hypothetical protein PMIN03_004688 [Paraphaeosphaeria minitans]
MAWGHRFGSAWNGKRHHVYNPFHDSAVSWANIIFKAVFNTIISLNVASLFITYIFSIGATSTTLSFYRAAGGRWGDLEFW